MAHGDLLHIAPVRIVDALLRLVSRQPNSNASMDHAYLEVIPPDLAHAAVLPVVELDVFNIVRLQRIPVQLLVHSFGASHTAT